ncbi:MAG: MGH1-like glycoside hydrolase domain-containing protein [Acidimicrobiales bacterium]
MTGSRDREPGPPARPTGPDVEPAALRDRAIAVLAGNERDGYVAPARGLYDHQHLWDTCFVAIGQRHYDVDAAMAGLRRMFGAQWANGMVPNIRFERGWRYWWDRRVWRSRVSPSAPRDVATGGISQPPMIAEAVVRVGEMLPRDRRLAWYRSVHEPLVAYHEWLHLDRGVDGSALVIQIHPWETGLDNSPPLLEVLGRSPVPWWLDLVARTRADRLATRLRWDTKYVPADQRSSTLEALRLYAALRAIRRDRYETDAALLHGPCVVQDLTFNSILVRADDRLREIGEEIGTPMSPRLAAAVRTHRSAMEDLWDGGTGSYYSRDARTRQLVKVPSIAGFMPLYAGCVDSGRAARLVEQLRDPRELGTPCPLPTVPVGSTWFQPRRYWQGPTWVNTNWLVIDGLRRYGYHVEAEDLRRATLAMVAESGFSEYYDPLTGEPAGAREFAWSAALAIDLLEDDGGAAGTGS